MEKELKFRSTRKINLIVAIFASCATLVIFLFGSLLSIIVGDTADNILALIILGSILITIWAIYFIFNVLIYKTVIVTEDSITLKKGKKILWTLNKADILDCVYIRCYDEASSDSMSMKFLTKDAEEYDEYMFKKCFSTSYCIPMSYNQANKISQMGYNVRFLDFRF